MLKKIATKKAKVYKALDELSDLYREVNSDLVNILGPNADTRGDQRYKISELKKSIDRNDSYIDPQYIGKLGK